MSEHVPFFGDDAPPDPSDLLAADLVRNEAEYERKHNRVNRAANNVARAALDLRDELAVKAPDLDAYEVIEEMLGASLSEYEVAVRAVASGEREAG